MTHDGAVGLRVAPATRADREAIYRLRHDIYARELGQHQTNAEAVLVDPLDATNTYLVARVGQAVVGFVSVTGTGPLSLDKYLTRQQLPFEVDESTVEVRLLTVVAPERGGSVAAHLMYAALQLAERRGATRVVAMGRREVLGLYRAVGLAEVGISIRSGAVDFEVMSATVPEIRGRASERQRLVERMQPAIDLDPPPAGAAACYHGGALWEVSGTGFDALEQLDDVVDADVLDAWFPPAPGVLSAVQEHLPRLVRSSPPADCAPMLEAVAAARGVDVSSLLPGAGSSALIFLAFSRLLSAGSRVLLLDPSYGEYSHVLEQVVGARVDRLVLHRRDHYDVDLELLETTLARGDYDLVVLVNPNSPTGRFVPGEDLRRVLESVRPSTMVWVDETYIDYVEHARSLQSFAAASSNVLVCTSLSKAYALSGLRAAYLCGPRDVVAELRRWTPPWALSLPAQVAVVRALDDPDYYRERHEQTRGLRAALTSALRREGLDVIDGCANFVLTHLPAAGPGAATVVSECRRHGVLLRDASTWSSTLGSHALRVAVKDEAGNARTLRALRAALETAAAH